jgi:alginate O-acetyltransferase complex protein AlgI
MLFSSQLFLQFFGVVFAAYWLLPRRRVSLALLLGACVWLGWSACSLLAPLPKEEWCRPTKEWWLWFAVASILDRADMMFWLAGMTATAVAVSLRAGPDRGRVWLLLTASFYFYASWNHELAMIVFTSAALDYALGRGMEALTSKPWRLALLLFSLVMNLGLLVYFKYSNFFLQSLASVLTSAGAPTSIPLLQVILPVGISFYTFEAINYTVDVYRGKVRAERNLLNFLLFITFFPHLVAGPIVRARDFLPQIRRPHRWDWGRAHLGVGLFILGLFKKLAIADRMAQYSDPVFFQPQIYGSYATWTAVIAYALQIYCDFSGYSDMALGAAHLLGYKLSQNFNMPYLAVNVSDFWRRWHISLSSWLRDYLFIPLGGSRHGARLTAENLIVTMTLGGLWHGANWTFVGWGVYHGTLLVLHRGLQRICKSWPLLDGVFQSVVGTVVRVALTFLCVAFGWVLFRAVTFQAAMIVFARLLAPYHGYGPPIHDSGLWYTVVLVLVCHALSHSHLWPRMSRQLPVPVLGFGYALALSLVLLLNLDTGAAFIYFQF